MVGAPGLISETWESTNLNRPYPLAASHIAAPVELSVQRDIDLIIEQLMGNIPGIHIDQLKVTHFGDDDGLWFLNIQNQNYSSLASGDNAFDSSASRLLACTDAATSTTNTTGKIRRTGSRISKTSTLLGPLGDI